MNHVRLLHVWNEQHHYPVVPGDGELENIRSRLDDGDIDNAKVDAWATNATAT
jgi:hypothetical protein